MAAPLLTFLVVAQGWRSAFLALAIAGIVWCLLGLVLGGTGPYAVTREPVAASPSHAAADRAMRRRTFLAVATSRTFLVLLLATNPMYALISVVLSWLPAGSPIGCSR